MRPSIALAAAVASCLPIAARADSPIVAVLDRAPCYGTCPSYQVVVREDGSVGYCGRSNVAEKGVRDASLGPKKLAELRAAFADAKFLAIDEKQFHRGLDSPDVVLFFRSGKKSKRVIFSNGFQPPRALAQLARKVDGIVGSKKWIGVAKEEEEAGGVSKDCGLAVEIDSTVRSAALAKLYRELRACPQPDGGMRTATFHAVVNGAGGIRELQCASGDCEGSACVAGVLRNLPLPPSLADGDPLELPVSY
jgi:hypothetical protein